MFYFDLQFTQSDLDTGKPALAVDVGGVLIKKDNTNEGQLSNEDTTWGDVANFHIDWKDALEYLSGKYTLWILSFAGRKRALETIDALHRADVQNIIPERRWIFVKHRLNKSIFMQNYNINTLIDDTLEIIEDCQQKGLSAIHFNHDNFWRTIREVL